ncbi:hypothetical protein DVG78_21235 [Runella aurantiaca]|uniref:Uncharacterized protein n=1 Tax=Runella aurantiaca TaxID=2282308 RepID=A0A369I9S0_9BACT|nr:hypothetical protein DVG78_21235 [Runella aurantiaca]
MFLPLIFGINDPQNKNRSLHQPFNWGLRLCTNNGLASKLNHLFTFFNGSTYFIGKLFCTLLVLHKNSYSYDNFN